MNDPQHIFTKITNENPNEHFSRSPHHVGRMEYQYVTYYVLKTIEQTVLTNPPTNMNRTILMMTYFFKFDKIRNSW